MTYLAPLGIAVPARRQTIARRQTVALFTSREGYSLRPPAGLRKNHAEMPLDAIWGKSGAASFNVIAMQRNAKRKRSLDELRAANLRVMSQVMENFKLHGQGRMTIDGAPAATLTSTFTMGTPPVPLRTLTVFVLRGEKFYTFSGVCPVRQTARYAPLFQKTLASVRWTK